MTAKRILALILSICMTFTLATIPAVATDEYVPKTIEVRFDPITEKAYIPEGYVVYVGDTLKLTRADISFMGDFANSKNGGEIEYGAVAMLYAYDIVNEWGNKLGSIWGGNELYVNDKMFSDGQGWKDSGATLAEPGKYTLSATKGRDAYWSAEYKLDGIEFFTFEVVDPTIDYTPEAPEPDSPEDENPSTTPKPDVPESDNSTSNEENSGVRLDDDGNLLYKPEDVGELANPVVTGLISPVPDDEWYAQEIGWKEEAYGIEYDMDTCAWSEREEKWIAAFVSGNSYDTLTRVTFPTTAIKGLLEPLDEHLPVDDEKYFNKDNIWKGLTYGIRAKATNYTYRDCGELYGVWFNQDMFDDNGLESPLELWENGEWTIPTMIDLAKQLTQDVDRDGVIDIYGFVASAKQLFTIGNGAKTVEFTEDGIELIWSNPAYIRGLEYINEISAYSLTNNAGNAFSSGKVAMYGERVQLAKIYSKTSPDYALNFEAVWVPFPKGENGEGYMGSISTGAETISIGKGAKNIEGAKVFICADICKFDYVSAENATMMMGVDEDTLERALSCEDKIITDYYNKIGNLDSQMQRVWSYSRAIGPVATIEKFSPSFQNQIDALVGEPHQHIYDNGCDMNCNLCNATRTVGEHVYTNVCDADCNECGSLRDVIGHIYDNDLDPDCNVCGDFRKIDATIKAGKKTGMKIELSADLSKGVEIYDLNGILTIGEPVVGDGFVAFNMTATKNSVGKIGKVIVKEIGGNANTLATLVIYVEESDDETIINPDTPTFVVDSTTTRVSDTFTVAVSTKNNNGIVSLKLKVGYDAEVLELVSMEAGGDFSGTSFGDPTKNPTTILWEDVLNYNNTAEGTIALLTFKVKDTAKAGTTEITVTYDPEDVYDFYLENIEFATENGTVTIVEYISGDVDGDGEVNNKDLGVLRRFLNDWDVEIDELASDVDRDGEVNNKDLGILRRYLNDWDVELK